MRLIKLRFVSARDGGMQYQIGVSRTVLGTAYRISGGDEPQLINLIESAADNIEAALSRAHLYTKSNKFQSAVQRVQLGAERLVELFPAIPPRRAKV